MKYTRFSGLLVSVVRKFYSPELFFLVFSSYAASDGKASSEDTLMRRLLRALLFGVTLYLGYVILLKFNGNFDS